LSQFLTERDQTLSTAVIVHEHHWTEGADCYYCIQNRGSLIYILNVTGLVVANWVSLKP